ncbi:MAG: phosphoenolpyruvate--protein phosphotransferase, partial [Bacteroidales bacterium]|nr:phosphoenolpyruvate--protein phosphotransferase [Bacteroidales bacterium]
FGSSIPLGAMVETPASVFAGRTIAEKVEFFSIGTNDLTQYIMAADRGNSGVSILYNPKDIAVKNAVEVVVSNAHEAGIKAGICGEAASDPEYAEFLLEAGIDSLSLSDPRMIPVTKRLIRR